MSNLTDETLQARFNINKTVDPTDLLRSFTEVRDLIPEVEAPVFLEDPGDEGSFTIPEEGTFFIAAMFLTDPDESETRTLPAPDRAGARVVLTTPDVSGLGAVSLTIQNQSVGGSGVATFAGPYSSLQVVSVETPPGDGEPSFVWIILGSFYIQSDPG